VKKLGKFEEEKASKNLTNDQKVKKTALNTFVRFDISDQSNTYD
jgi:hypothetical protein